MGVSSFEELKTGICALLGSPVPEEDGDIPKGTGAFALVVNGVPVALTYADTLPGRAFAFCALGDCPDDIEAQAMRRLLEMNFLLYRGSTSSFGRDPMSGEVVFQCELVFERTTPQSALDLLGKMSQQASVWRSTHFLEAEASSGAAGSFGPVGEWVRG